MDVGSHPIYSHPVCFDAHPWHHMAMMAMMIFDVSVDNDFHWPPYWDIGILIDDFEILNQNN